MANFFSTGELTEGQNPKNHKKSHKHIGNSYTSKAWFAVLVPKKLHGITSMSQSYNMVNYGVSQLLTNVIKHKGITTTLTNCVTRCKHHFWSLCLWFWSALLPTLHVSTHTTWSIMVSHPLLTNVIKHKGITTNLQSVWPGANTPFAVCGLFCSAFLPPTHPHPPPYFIVLN